MMLFVDTSAFYAILDRDDANHERAKAIWIRVLHESAGLLTNNYVLGETAALVQGALRASNWMSCHYSKRTGFRQSATVPLRL